jgi:hypothetical protein
LCIWVRLSWFFATLIAIVCQRFDEEFRVALVFHQPEFAARERRRKK